MENKYLKDSASLGWLAAVAHELGENDIANQVMASAKKLEMILIIIKKTCLKLGIMY